MSSELQSIIDGLAARLNVATSLTDSQFNSIVFGPHEDADIDQIRRQALLNRHTSPAVRAWFESFGASSAAGPVRIPADRKMRAKSRIIIPARSGTITYGFLCLLDDDYQISEKELALVSEAMPEVTRLLIKQHRDRQRGADQLHRLLSNERAEQEEAVAELRDSGGISRNTAIVLRYSPPLDEVGVERKVDEQLRHAAGRSPGSVLRFVEPSQTVLLIKSVSGVDSVALAHDLVRHCGHLVDPSGYIVAGIGDEHPDFSLAVKSWEQAKLAVRAAISLPTRCGPVAEWSKLGAIRTLLSLTTERLAESIDPRFAGLLAVGDPTLIPTLDVYFDCAGHAQTAASILRIHRGTLYYRLRKAQEESGFDLSKGSDVLALHLALKAHMLTAAPSGANPPSG